MHARAPNERAYIVGKAAAGEKPRLIVEITQKRSEQYKEHIQTILKKLQEEHLTKGEALELREELC